MSGPLVLQEHDGKIQYPFKENIYPSPSLHLIHFSLQNYNK